MSATIPTIAAALGTALTNANQGFNVYDYLSDTFTDPAVLIASEEIEFDQTFGHGTADHHFLVYVIVSRSSEISGINRLDLMRSNTGSTSIRAILENDITLGGVVTGSRVIKARAPQAVSLNGAEYLSCVFEVLVISA